MSTPVLLGYLDTNLFVHALYPHDPHYPRCRALLAGLADGTATGRLDVVVVYELTFILARRRRFPDHPAIERYLRGILAAPGVQVDARATLLAALSRWATHGVGFADAWLLASAQTAGWPICPVNNRDFSGVPNTFRV
ncbi:MAG: type II toxin-antitoxin system VapC family toxin [Thermomicrobiales bacterium]